MEKGDFVQIDVTWPDGRTRVMTGTLICIVGDKAYVETKLGPVEGPIDSLEEATR